ncbi:MAG: hypothetical protein WCQ00_02910 [bacterium]
MMSRPKNLKDGIKYYFWKYIVSPVFPYIRDGLLKLRIIYHKGRQPYHIGFLDSKKKVEDFRRYLGGMGFRNNRFAWIDSDEILSMRIFDGYKHQYHIRLFKDREIRAHYEQTPEIHPFGHFFESVFEARSSEFKKYLGKWCFYK